MQTEIEDMRAQLTEKEETVLQQRAMINDLQATISNQRNDIRSAMDLIVHRPSASKVESPGRSLRHSHDVQQFPVTSIPVFSPSRAESPTNHHTHYHWHQDPTPGTQCASLKQQNTQAPVNDPWSQQLIPLSKGSAANVTCRFDQFGHSPQKRRYGANTSVIRQDMDKIDLEIADLDAALKAAAQKFS